MPDDKIKALDDTDVLEHIRKATRYGKARSAAAEREELHKGEIKKLLGSATVGTIDGVPVVTFRWENRTIINREVLRARFKKAWEATAENTQIRKLNLSPGKRKNG